MGKAPKKKKPKRKLSAYNKHVRREMRAGRTMKQAAASWKPGSKKSSPKKKTGKSKTTGGRRVTKNPFNVNKIIGLIPKIALIAPAAGIALGPDSPQEKIRKGIQIYTGVDMRTGQFVMSSLQQGWTPYIVTKVITTVVRKLGSFIGGFM